LLPFTKRIGVFLSGAFCVVFLVATLQALVRGIEISDCGCIGKRNGTGMVGTIWKNIGLLLLLVLSLLQKEENEQRWRKITVQIITLCAAAATVLTGIVSNVANNDEMDAHETEALVIGRTSFEELARIVREKDTSVLVIDARPDLFFADGHIQGAVNISTEHFGRDLKAARARIEIAKHLVVYCANTDCGAAEAVVRRLREAGIKTKTDIYPGGWEEWEKRTTRESRAK
jgi:rhodanese-related sulfurtransferase